MTSFDESGESPPSSPILVADEQPFVSIDPDRLVQIADFVLSEESVLTTGLSIALVDDATIHDINRRFLDHDYPTDVISFSLSDDLDDPGAEGSRPRAIEGEIVISGETAVRVAAQMGHSGAYEVALYLVHGLLHLCGYDDHDSGDRRRMEERQETLLQKLGIQPNYRGIPSPGRCSPVSPDPEQTSDLG